MKKTVLQFFGMAIMGVSVFAFTQVGKAQIKGKITPPAGAAEVWSIAGADTVKSPISEGAFELTVNAGTYTVIVPAIAPLKQAVKEGVLVAEGASIDLGEISLSE